MVGLLDIKLSLDVQADLLTAILRVTLPGGGPEPCTSRGAVSKERVLNSSILRRLLSVVSRAT